MKNRLQADDGSLTVGYEDVQQVCICVVIYPLLQYLLLNDLEMCKHHTAYILDETIHPGIRKKLPSYTFREYPATPFYKVWRKVARSFQALTRDWNHPYLKRALIYAQDHDIPAILIGKHSYYLLQDAPNIYTMLSADACSVRLASERKASSLRGKIESMIYGAPFISHHGQNPQCKKIFLTEENTAPVLTEKECQLNPLKDLWSASSQEKKDFILHIFGVDSSDMDILKSYPVVFFTQPWLAGQLLSEEECFELHQKIFQHYDHSQLLIKTHPRDHFDYAKYFPDIAIYRKPVNVELLSLLNVSLKRAVTICSAAVYSFPESVEVDWFGPEVHPKIKAVAGADRFDLPRAYNQMAL